MKVLQNISLREFNTFGLNIYSSYFTSINDVKDLEALLHNKEFAGKKYMILGGGSNVLFIHDFEGLILRNELRGIHIINEDENYVWVKAASGELWQELVLWSIDRNLGGIENLSLIPGSVGAGPMQNIGAYGVELKDVFYELEAMNLTTFEMKTFNKVDCKFGYRESVFKHELKDQYFISSVTFQLNKNPILNISYGAISQELSKMNVENPTVKDVSDAVIHIRKSKLPDPKILGNSGSFFKNPEINMEQYNSLKESFPAIVGYPIAHNKIKLAAGWLIEQCGWKGKRIGETGSHKDQSLVLVNYGFATGREIYTLALQIKQSVFEKFGVVIEPEVNIIGKIN